MSIETLKQDIETLVAELIGLSNSKTIIERSFSWLKFNYVGRGSESMQLYLPNQYSEQFRSMHMQETIERLTKIKKDLLEG